ncbi:MAG: hypothetical protein LKE79_11430, partial [Lachnospiraceae bacterium]|nr:hypothetical protein [Lachnospiraceae bacterium]
RARLKQSGCCLAVFLLLQAEGARLLPTCDFAAVFHQAGCTRHQTLAADRGIRQVGRHLVEESEDHPEPMCQRRREAEEDGTGLTTC